MGDRQVAIYVWGKSEPGTAFTNFLAVIPRSLNRSELAPAEPGIDLPGDLDQREGYHQSVADR